MKSGSSALKPDQKNNDNSGFEDSQNNREYTHATTSLLFSRLVRTNKQLMSPIKMLKLFGIAPPGGEITGGGLDALHAKGKPSFGLLDATGPGSYSLERIIAQYASGNYSYTRQDFSLEQGIQNSKSMSFSNLNIILIYLARAKAQGIENVIDEKILNQLLIEAQAAVQFFYLLLFLGKDIHPKEEAFTNADVIDAVATHLTFENILQKIIDNNVNVKEIYENPTQAGLEEIVNLFTLPTESTVLNFLKKPRAVTLSLVNPFKVGTIDETNCKNEDEYDYFDPAYISLRLPQNVSGYRINNLLRDFVQNRLHPTSFREMDEAFLKHIKVMSKRTKILKDILEKNACDVMYSPAEKAFLENPFPMVLVCEENDKFELFDKNNQEFRAKKPLAFGTDIKLIATDTAEHQKVIVDFMQEHDINNIEVVFFEQLIERREKKKAPRP